MGDPTVAFSAERAAALAGISLARLRRWQRHGIVGPRKGRWWSFRDLVALRTVAKLVNEHHVRLDTLRSLRAWLDERWESQSFASMRFWVAGSELVFADPGKSGARLSHRPRGQVTADHTQVDLKQVAAGTVSAIAVAIGRPLELVGKLEKKRGVMGGALLIAGTRIPVKAVQDFAAAGFTRKQILERYSTLQEADVEAALEDGRGAKKRRARAVA